MTAKKRQVKKKPVNRKAEVKVKTWRDNIFFYAIGLFVLAIVLLQIFL